MRLSIVCLILLAAVAPLHAITIGFDDLTRDPIPPGDGWFPNGDVSDNLLLIHQAYTFPSDGIITAVNILDDGDTTSEDLQLLTFSFDSNTEIYTVTNIVSMPDDTASWVGTIGGVRTFTLGTPISVNAGDFFGHYGSDNTHAIPFESLHGNPAGSSFISFLNPEPTVGSQYAKAALMQNRDYHINVEFTVVPVPAAAWAALPLLGLLAMRKRSA